MKALVTGANGFIGTHLVEALMKKGYQVSCPVRPGCDRSWLEKTGATLVEGDFYDACLLERLLPGIDHLFHVAGVIDAGAPDAYHRINSRATRILLEQCVNHNPALGRFVYVSSIAASGPTPAGRVKNETDECSPVSEYGKSKRAAEQAVLAFKEKLPTVIIRPPVVIGPRQKELLLSIRLVKNRVIPRVGNGDTQASLVYVTDLAEALILAARKKEAVGRTYFVTDGRGYSWRQVTGEIARHFGEGRRTLTIPFALQYALALVSEQTAPLLNRRPVLSRALLLASRDYYWRYDGSRIEQELGFHARVLLEEGIQKTIDWHRHNRWP